MNQPMADPLVVMALQDEGGEVLRAAGIPVTYTGVGKVNAAYGLTRRLGEYAHAGKSLPVVVNFGTAGSRCLVVGSIVGCDSFVQRDMDASGLGFRVGQTPFDAAPEPLKFPIVFDALSHHTCGTGDSFVTSTHEGVGYEVIDMEAYSLAKVCWLYGVAFTSVKYISDGANSDAAFCWRENVRKAADRFVALYEHLRSRRMGRDEQ